MAKKSVKLAKNFYYSKSGSIQFRKMIRGELISCRTGLTDPYEVNKLATDLSIKFINEHFQLVKPDVKKKQIRYNVLKDKWLKTKSHLSLHTIRTYDSNISAYLKKGISKDWSKSYQNAVRRDFNIFTRWCIRQGYDMKVLKGSTSAEGRMRILNESELHRVLECIPEKDFRDMVEFTYYTGARRKEVNKPRAEWLRKTNNGVYYLQVIKKGGYKRIVRVNSQALEVLKRRDFEFWSFRKQWLTRGFKRYARKANVKGVCFHDLRRTFGYNVLYSSKDILTVAKLMGISVKVAEKHYLPLVPTQIEDFIL